MEMGKRRIYTELETAMMKDINAYVEIKKHKLQTAHTYVAKKHKNEHKHHEGELCIDDMPKTQMHLTG